MTKDDMERAFQALSETLNREGHQAEIVIAGGAWMALVLGSRDVTKDIDAYLSAPTEPIRRAVLRVANTLNLPQDWLNDGIKGFFYGTPPQNLWREYPALRVYTVTADYMLAMKVFAARNEDREDTKALIRHLSITTATEVLDIVERYIPLSLLTSKHQYFAESCVEP
ncbi:MAG: DUF6036 family nucleotidyltransferase [Sulfobacillus thermotolerans]|nr:DUF6036 family nucleotidyltransferase [Sulfobacillus thermotolerans]